MSRNFNLFAAIAVNGSDDGYDPRVTSEFRPTNAPAGSPEKIEELRRRVERGWPLWHALDRTDFSDDLPQLQW
jgi:hypothetical protein